MIGDTQGTSAIDVDISEVNLKGRKKIDSSTKAQGDFYYEAGGRYESTISTDSAYRTNAVDFVEWNKDLYIARYDSSYTGSNTNNGTLQRILDGGAVVAALQHDPPASASVNPDYPYKSTESSWNTVNGGSGQELVPAYAGQPYIAGTSPTYGNISTTNNWTFASPSGSTLFTGYWSVANGVYTARYLSNIFPTFPNGISLTRLYGTTPISSSNFTPTLVDSNIETDAMTVLNSISGQTLNYSSGSQNYRPSAGDGVYWDTGYLHNSFGTGGLTGSFTSSQVTLTILSTPLTLYPTSSSSSSPYAVTYYWYIDFPQYTFTGNFNSTFLYSKMVLWDSYYGQTSAGTSGQSYIPSTPAFTYDDARAFVYRQFTDDADKLAGWGLAPAEGAHNSPWLENNRSLASTSDAGYYLSIINNSTGSPVLPQESQDKTKASLVQGGKFITETDALRSPQRLNFTIGAPADGGSVTCYRLYRVDSFNSITSPLYLGYIKPDPNISVTLNSSGNIQISGLSNSGGVSLKDYRVSWKAYQGTTLRTTTAGSYFDAFGYVNQSGSSIYPSSGIAYIYVNNDSDNFSGADIWIEERVIDNSYVDPSGNSDIWAVIGAIDYFKYTNTSNVTSSFATLSDYLDVFSSSVASGVGSGTTLTAPPDNLKFLEESNNFFFAVGTLKTDIGSSPVGRWGTGDNKGDTWLFISTYNNPRDWPLDAYLEFDSSITGLKAYSGETIVWTNSGTFRVFGSQANQMRKVKLPTTEGMKEGSHRTAVQVNQYLVWVSASGICVYNGSSVQNISKGRFDTLTIITDGNQAGLNAGQIDGRYYVINTDHRGYVVDFNLDGFPITEVDFVEYDNISASVRTSILGGADYTNPVFVYRPAVNKLYCRLGIVEGSTTENKYTYLTRNFDGNQFGRNKLIHSITINGPSGSTGTVRVFLDNSTSYHLSKYVTIANYPVTVYLPALSIADVWSVMLLDWAGDVDYIDSEYEVI
jgi:hypothetical protein